ncbi:MAG: CTP synthase [Nitrospirota bacterium]
MKLAIIAEYDPNFEPHVHTDAAIVHAASALGLDVQSEWISSVDAHITTLSEFNAIWLAPGSPYQNLSRTLDAIRFAREQNVATLGTCGGYQHMVIEFARNVAGIRDAQHAEYDPYASRLIVSQLTCSLVGREMEIVLSPGSKTSAAYKAHAVTERYYCNFGVNPDFVEQISSAGFKVVGRDADGACRVMELSHHRFFVGTLFVPQARSRPDRPHPLITAFLLAAEQSQRRVSSQ